MDKKRIYLILVSLTIVGGLLRFWGNTKNPPSLNIDEVAIGYDAYSILKTGRDQYGEFLPLSFKSVGDYKPPVLIYLTVPSIAIFGLNEFAIRFPVALISTLTIFVSYFLFKKILRDEKKALLTSALLTISPWHIYFSRYAVEAIVALFFLIVGLYYFFRLFEGKYYYSILSGIFLAISVYAYHAERLFIPMFIVSLLIIKNKLLASHKKELILFISTIGLLTLPLYYSMFFGADQTRARTTFIANDIEFTRPVAVEPISKGVMSKTLGSEKVLLATFWARKYLNYLRPSFLFFNGLNMTSSGSMGLGVLYIFEFFWLILGVYKLAKEKSNKTLIIFTWLLLAIIPASLAQDEQHALRSLVALPALLMVVSTGALYFYDLLNQKLSVGNKNIVITLFSIMIVWNLLHALMVFSVYFPRHRGEHFMEGTKETVIYALDNIDNYEQIVFDPYRGIDGPYTVSIPHMYILFYSKYEPSKYQNETKTFGNDIYGFNKYSIRKINWIEDSIKTNTLFIASPWSIPEGDLKDGELLKKVFMSDGNLTFIIASPKH